MRSLSLLLDDLDVIARWARLAAVSLLAGAVVGVAVHAWGPRR